GHERRLRSGEPWGVKLILPGIGAGHPALPFVIEDVGGRQLRIPTTRTTHPNGTTGTAGMAVSVHNRQTASAGFEVLFGAAQSNTEPLHPSYRSLHYRVGGAWLDVIERPDEAEGLISIALIRPGTAGISWLASGRDAIALVSG